MTGGQQRQDSAASERSSGGIAFDRGGPAGQAPVVLLHAGIADRRMWDPQWRQLIARRPAIRLDLRGFGDSRQRPDGLLDPVADVLSVLDDGGIERVHLVGASMGAGVAAELALTAPGRVMSLLLVAPGGSLFDPTARDDADLQGFLAAERTALRAGDLDAAVEANIRWWVLGPDRSPEAVPEPVQDLVRRMQRLAFEITDDWDDVDEAELDPPVWQRLTELRLPIAVLTGTADLGPVQAAADRVVTAVPGAERMAWAAAHLPSMEHPEAFAELLLDWLDRVESAA